MYCSSIRVSFEKRLYVKVCSLQCVMISAFRESQWHCFETSPATRLLLSRLWGSKAQALHVRCIQHACEEEGSRPLTPCRFEWRICEGRWILKGWWQEVLLFKFITNGLTNMILEDPSFLMFPGTSSVSQIREYFCFCCTFRASIKNFRYAESNFKSQPAQIGFVTVEAVAGNIFSMLFS